jgi:hypothetical protein
VKQEEIVLTPALDDDDDDDNGNDDNDNDNNINIAFAAFSDGNCIVRRNIKNMGKNQQPHSWKFEIMF